MQPVAEGIAGLAGLLIIAIWILRRRLNDARRTLGTGDASRVQPPLQFAPMKRLLSEADVEFVRAQSGYDVSIERRLRARRVLIGRQYLKELAGEFDRLHLALRILSLSAGVDRSDLAATLLRQRIRFTTSRIVAEVRLAGFAFGWKPVALDTLVDAVESMRRLVESATPVPAVAAGA